MGGGSFLPAAYCSFPVSEWNLGVTVDRGQPSMREITVNVLLISAVFLIAGTVKISAKRVTQVRRANSGKL